MTDDRSKDTQDAAGQDEALQRAFDALRAVDERSAPPFDGMWRHAVADAVSAPSVRRRYAPLIAAAAVVVAAVGLALARRPGSGERTIAADSAAAMRADRDSSIVHWRAPTDVLLQYTGREFLGAPALGASALDRFIPDSKLIKGD